MRICCLILSLLMVPLFCAGQDVRYNFASGQDFSKYRTYKWVQIKDAEKLNQLAEQQLQAAVDAEMSKKGLNRTDGEKADLFLGYQAAIGQEKQYTSFSTDWGYGPGWYGPYHGMGGGMTTGETSTIYVGQVSLDMYDPTQKQLVWRGSASKTLDTKAKPEKQKKNLGKAMAKLLKNFPPPPKKS